MFLQVCQSVVVVVVLVLRNWTLFCGCSRPANVLSCPELIMPTRALLLLLLPGPSLLAILSICPQGEKCSERQFCDQRGRVTAFRANKLSFSTDLRGLQVRGRAEEGSLSSLISDGSRTAGLLSTRGWGSAAGWIIRITLTLMRNKYRLIIVMSLGIQRVKLQTIHCCLCPGKYPRLTQFLSI